jgi:nitrate/TMAO reductase-like tetraheme cytochrome c subunit
MVPGIVRPLHYFEMSGISYPVMQCHIPEEQMPQLHYCENLKTHISKIYAAAINI